MYASAVVEKHLRHKTNAIQLVAGEHAIPLQSAIALMASTLNFTKCTIQHSVKIVKKAMSLLLPKTDTLSD